MIYHEFEWGVFFSDNDNDKEKSFSPPPRWEHTLRHLRGWRKGILKRIDSNVRSIKKTLGETDGNNRRVFLLLQELKKEQSLSVLWNKKQKSLNRTYINLEEWIIGGVEEPLILCLVFFRI